MEIRISLVLILAVSRLSAQSDIVIVMLKSERVELVESLRLIKTFQPKLVAIDADLECEEDDEDIDLKLARELETIERLLLPSEVVRFGSTGYRDIVGCSYLYPDGVETGFVNLIRNDINTKVIDKIQIKNTYRNKTSYHMAVKIALALDPKQTNHFLDVNSDTLSIDLHEFRRFKVCVFEDLAKGKLDGIVHDSTIVLLTNFPQDFLFVRESYTGKLTKMSSAEICANIAFSIIGR